MLLTSSDGPGRTLGTIYFTVWIGSIVSILLLICEFNDVFLDGEDMRESQQESEGKAQTGDSAQKILASLSDAETPVPKTGTNSNPEIVDPTFPSRVRSTVKQSYGNMFRT